VIERGMTPHNETTFRNEGDNVRVAASPFTVESAYGSVHPLNPSRAIEEMFDQAAEEHAQHVVQEANHRARARLIIF
jgi:hypothetical protein